MVGAILAIPFAAVIKIVLREAGRPRRERIAGLRTSASLEASHGGPQLIRPAPAMARDVQRLTAEPGG